eukprot:3321671-Pyramimonas_sp.AAC.1
MGTKRPSAGFQDRPTPKGRQYGQANIVTTGADYRGNRTPEDPLLATDAREFPPRGSAVTP